MTINLTQTGFALLFVRRIAVRGKQGWTTREEIEVRGFHLTEDAAREAAETDAGREYESGATFAWGPADPTDPDGPAELFVTPEFGEEDGSGYQVHPASLAIGAPVEPAANPTPTQLAETLKRITEQLHDVLGDGNVPPADRVAVLPDLREAGIHFGGVLRAAGCGTYENAVGVRDRAIWDGVCTAAEDAATLITKGALAIEGVAELAEDALLASRATA